MKNKNFSRNEILYVVEAVARDKGIPKELIIKALEEAIVTAARNKYGAKTEIKASINKKSGNIEIYREILVNRFDEKRQSIMIDNSNKEHHLNSRPISN